MTQEEKYLHFRQCIEDLNDAWRVLTELRDRPEFGLVEAAAFRYALVAYARPYTRSRVNVSKQERRLGRRHVPPGYLKLHSRLLEARMKIHAHSDLSERNARLYVREFGRDKIATLLRDGIDKLEELQNLAPIIELVEQTLDRMYVEEERMRQKLPTSR